MSRGLRSTLAAIKKQLISAAQWPIEKFMALLIFFSDKRRLFPDYFKKILILVITPGITAFFSYAGLKNEPTVSWWPTFFTDHGVKYAVIYSACMSCFTAFIAFLIIKGFLPLLFFMPHAVSLRAMGLLEAAVEHDGGMQKAIKKYMRWHNENDPIKVICISGHNLFCTSENPDAPLGKFVNIGKIQALFPKSLATNPTIKSRYDTYKDTFKMEKYPVIGDLVREVDITKDLLRRHAGNRVYEHDELCMWRVVLLTEHCIVQNYFPNHAGGHSDVAPVFVFEKEGECTFTYYETFSKMFDLLTKA